MRQRKRAALRAGVIRALRATWRLFTGDLRPPLDKRCALARASVAAASASPRPVAWLFADAVLVYRQWMCVLENGREVFVVEVHSYTGQARVIARTLRRRPERTVAAPRCRHTGRSTGIRSSRTATRMRHRSPIPPPIGSDV